MKTKTLIFLTLAAVLLTACGASEADQQAAVQTQVALLQQQTTPQEGAPEAAPVEGEQAGQDSAGPQQFGELMPQIPSDAKCVPINSPRVLATVTDIWDGDSFQVKIDGQSYEVRLIGVDKGDQSDETLRQLVDGKEVMLITDTTDVDKYGRLPRYVIADGTFVNLELLRRGAAYLSLIEPDLACEKEFKAYK